MRRNANQGQVNPPQRVPNTVISGARVAAVALTLLAVYSLFSTSSEEEHSLQNPDNIGKVKGGIKARITGNDRDEGDNSRLSYAVSHASNIARRMIEDTNVFSDIKNPFLISREGLSANVFNLERVKEVFGLDLDGDLSKISERGLSPENLSALMFFREYERHMCPDSGVTSHGESCRTDAFRQLGDLKAILFRNNTDLDRTTAREFLGENLVTGTLLGHCKDCFTSLLTPEERRSPKYSSLGRYSNGNMELDAQQKSLVLGNERMRGFVEKLAGCFRDDVVDQYVAYAKGFNYDRIADAAFDRMKTEQEQNKNKKETKEGGHDQNQKGLAQQYQQDMRRQTQHNRGR